uniref:Uncharacterized protein AlNc14C33G2993 n=1 Tax=Albugo laibachii Nc14 TaxID=890382 RepID=F0W899_9STRA|nr:conserved hypothetical protein [Albugo laibachii Nc14]|eukprot:CCA17299.1 conserved hypothetical protein [Albugo laibachii Nc14]
MEQRCNRTCCRFEADVTFVEDDYRICVVDIERAGLVAIAIKKDSASLYLTCRFDENELAAASIDKSLHGCKRLIGSLILTKKYICEQENEPETLEPVKYLHLTSLLKNNDCYKPSISHQAAIDYLSNATTAPTASILNVASSHKTSSCHPVLHIVATGLAELCRAQPPEEMAINWLGNWLLKHNPTKPIIEDDC